MWLEEMPPQPNAAFAHCKTMAAHSSVIQSSALPGQIGGFFDVGRMWRIREEIRVSRTPQMPIVDRYVPLFPSLQPNLSSRAFLGQF